MGVSCWALAQKPLEKMCCDRDVLKSRPKAAARCLGRTEWDDAHCPDTRALVGAHSRADVVALAPARILEIQTRLWSQSAWVVDASKAESATGDSDCTDLESPSTAERWKSASVIFAEVVQGLDQATSAVQHLDASVMRTHEPSPFWADCCVDQTFFTYFTSLITERRKKNKIRWFWIQSWTWKDFRNKCQAFYT